MLTAPVSAPWCLQTSNLAPNRKPMALCAAQMIFNHKFQIAKKTNVNG